MSDQQKSLLEGVPIFSERFLTDHAGRIVTDARTALLELVANAYDAGARTIEIDWPEERGGRFSIRDDGIGMTEAEFSTRWRELCYDRVKSQGTDVVFPAGSPKRLKRKAMGQHGKGRHAPFCFSDKYLVSTCKSGKSITVEVSLGSDHSTPFLCQVLERGAADLVGTSVSVDVEQHHLKPNDVVHLLGTKFLVDPSLAINVNGERVDLLGLEGVEKTTIDLSDGQSVEVHFIDSIEHTKTTQLRGITWWVNTRMVGEHSWKRLDASDDTYLDGRSEQAKRFSFIVTADCLKPYVKPDWSGFYADRLVNEAHDAIHDHVEAKLDTALADSRQVRKRAVLEKNVTAIRQLPPLSRKTVGQFVSEVQRRCPKLSERDLSNATEVLANLEQSRAGYDLLGQLASCSPDDLDTWNRLMTKWSASNAEVVLNELQRRLTLISRMESLVNSPLADELHELQPLFERGLWIFGPEYEAIDFRSNRGLSESISTLLHNSDYKPPKKRPDFVALPHASIGAYSCDSFDKNGEVSGIRKVAVLELKKGGFKLTQQEVYQAHEYCKHLRKGGRLSGGTSIVAYVLGAAREDDLEPLKAGNIEVIPEVYDTVLQKARRRTFNLQQKLNADAMPFTRDDDVEAVLSQSTTELDFDSQDATNGQPS